VNTGASVRKNLKSKLLLLLGSLLALLLLGLPLISRIGDDFYYWQIWLDNVARLGPIEGYRTTLRVDYPPLTFVIFFGVAKFSHLFGLELFTCFQLSLLLFLFLTLLLFWGWTKDLWLTGLLQLSLLLNSLVMHYIDLYFAPALLLSLWALKTRRFFLFTLFFSSSCLIKWQPLILAPFILIYLLDEGKRRVSIQQWFIRGFKRLGRAVILPLLIIFTLVVAIFGIEFLMAFRRAASDSTLSGNALNFNWILTHLLHLFYPNNFGVRFSPIGTDLRLLTIPKLVFLAVYFLVFLAFWKQKKTFENLLRYALLGYLTYFTFNTGVYENHLFLAILLSISLSWLNRKDLPLFLTWTLLANLNLLLTLRLTEKEPSSLQMGAINTFFFSSILEVSLFIWFFTTTLLNQPTNPAS